MTTHDAAIAAAGVNTCVAVCLKGLKGLNTRVYGPGVGEEDEGDRAARGKAHAQPSRC